MNENTPWGSAGQPGDAPVMKREAFTFHGTAREYFGIWIVNVLLTILTLGIYSAWAKVRRLRYFYGNTALAGATFDYHARPVQILIGRIIVLAVLIAYNVALNFLPPEFGIALALLFVLALPVFIARGLRFNARVTSYRNVRFDFHGRWGGAFKAYVLGGLLTWGSLGILAPLASRWMWTYTLGNLTYGGRPVSCDPRLDRLYGQLWLPALVLIAGTLLLGAAALFVALVLFDFFTGLLSGDGGPSIGAALTLIYAAFIPVFLLYALAGLLYRAGVRNVAYSETVIDKRHLMESSISRWRYAFVAITNFIATIASLGLLRPWAAVRMTHFLAAGTALHTTDSLETYASSLAASGSAVGSEYMDVEGLDIGF